MCSILVSQIYVTQKLPMTSLVKSLALELFVARNIDGRTKNVSLNTADSIVDLLTEYPNDACERIGSQSDVACDSSTLNVSDGIVGDTPRHLNDASETTRTPLNELRLTNDLLDIADGIAGILLEHSCLLPVNDDKVGVTSLSVESERCESSSDVGHDIGSSSKQSKVDNHDNVNIPTYFTT